MDREKVINAYEDFVNGYECFCTSDDYEYEMHKAVLALLKEQEHKDRMFHALEDDWKRLKELLKEQEDKIRQLELALKIMKGNGIKVDTEGR